MNRRQFVKLAGLACFAAAATPTARAAERKPNIIYIMADDLGYGDLSCYGQEKFSTPNIDRLASEGLKFTQHYAGSTVCAPSRCALMTGLHTGHCYVRGNKEVKPEGQAPMPADTVTVPKLLKQAGYATGIVGKWGLGAPGSHSDPIDQGFDFFFGYNCQREAHSYYPGHLWRNREKVILEGNQSDPKTDYSHDLLTRAALDFVRDNRDKPFFLYLPYTIPHAAMQVPDDSLDKFKGSYPEPNPHTTGHYARQDTPRAAFAAMVTRMDGDVGRLLGLLGELGIDDNTLVMFTSDNGPHLEGGHDADFFNSNGPLRGHKRDLYEGGIRVPFLARWPKRIRPGRITDHQAAFWDLLPTACEITGVKAPGGIDGISYLPTLVGGPQAKHDYLYWEFHEQGRKQAVRLGDWKGVYLLRDDRFELYNLAEDIGETNNLADRRPDVVNNIRAIMRHAHVPSKQFPIPQLDRSA